MRRLPRGSRQDRVQTNLFDGEARIRLGGDVMGPEGDGPGPEETPVPEGPYPLWDRPTSSAAPRSRLYSLEPIGIGTDFVESLTGYLSRLAEAHQVHLSVLVARVCAPEIDYASLRIPGNCGLSTLWTSARAMNGSRQVGRDWVDLLERLTGRHDLRFTTWLPWGDLIDSKHLIRATRAWCPACYADWRSRGTVIYEPLLWTVASVRCCPLHRTPLADRCDSAECGGKGHQWLGARARPGYCVRCRRWLGDVTGATHGRDDVLEEDLWRAHAVGELLSIAPVAEPLKRSRIRDALNELVHTQAQGNVSTFARMVNHHPETVRQWCQGGTLQLDSLLELTSRLSVSPRQFVTGDLSGAALGRAAGEDGESGAPEGVRVRHVKFNVERVRGVLRAILASEENPPPALREVARRLGMPDASALYRRLPELSRAIAARYVKARRLQTFRRQDALREEVRQVAAALHAAGQYPSCNVVRARLSHPAAFRKAIVREAWETSLRQYGWEKGTQGRRPLLFNPSGCVEELRLFVKRLGHGSEQHPAWTRVLGVDCQTQGAGRPR
jgi:hypothetical protein